MASEVFFVQAKVEVAGSLDPSYPIKVYVEMVIAGHSPISEINRHKLSVVCAPHCIEGLYALKFHKAHCCHRCFIHIHMQITVNVGLSSLR